MPLSYVYCGPFTVKSFERSLALRVFNPDETTHFVKFQATNYSSYDPLLVVGKDPIKFIGHDEIPIFKYLGRKFQADLRTNIITKDITEKLLKWLKTVDETSLTGPMKAWITNHHICAKLAWSLLIY